jgi:aminoglycoside phosphotransferase (APT) family kinase protein
MSNMQQRLQAYYESRLPAEQAPQIENLVGITTGWEHEMYAFDLTYLAGKSRQREVLVLRIYDSDDAQEISAREFYGMRRLHEAGYPVPRVHALEPATGPIGKPFVIMERIEGQLYGTLLGTLSGDEKSALPVLFCELLVRLHRLDWRLFADYSLSYETGGAYTFVDYYLADERATLQRHSLSGFVPVVEWLQQRRDDVPCTQPSVVHRDFHINNILIRDDGSPVVIDWTGLHVSDRRVDLGWTLLGVEAWVGVERRNYLLREYERQAGTNIEHLAWFDVLAALWRLRHVVLLMSGREKKIGFHAGTRAMVEQEMNGLKRVYEILLERTSIRVPEAERLFA